MFVVLGNIISTSGAHKKKVRQKKVRRYTTMGDSVKASSQVTSVPLMEL